MGYMDRPQSIEKEERRKKVLAYFDRNGGTIAEISKATGISKSSVQRFLNEVDNVETLKNIKAYLQNNQELGRSTGGKNSSYSKDENGKFIGSNKRK